MINLAKNCHFLWDILNARLSGRYIPFAVQFSITSKCNSRCNYCYAKYFERTLPELDTARIKKIVSGLARFGTKRLSLVGGEPLVKKDISQIIDFIKKKNLECALTSNGYLVPNLLETVKKLDLLVLSLDGREENHDANREKGSWKKVMTALKLAYEYHIPLQISTVLTKHNLNDLEWLANLGRRYKFWISFTPLINQSDNDKKIPLYKLLPINEQYRRAFQKIISMKRKGAPFLYHEKIYRAALNWPDFKIDRVTTSEPEFYHIKCLAGKYSAIIDSNGDLYPCPQLVDVFKAKNIIKDGLVDAWKYINNNNCKACFSPCSNNLSLIFSLDFGVLQDLWKSYRLNQ